MGSSTTLTHPLPPPLTPSMYRGPSSSSSFHLFSHLSSYCSLSSNVHRFSPLQKKKKKIIFPDSETSSQDCLFSSKFLSSVVCSHILHFLTTNSLLPHLQAGFHQYPFTENVFRRSPVAFSPPNEKGFAPRPHSPLPFNNLHHQSPGPMFLLGSISYVYSFLSISNDRTLGRSFSSTTSGLSSL